MTTASRTHWLTRRGVVRLSEESLEASRWAARGLALFALAAFTILLVQKGGPRSPQQQSWELTAQYAVLVLLAIGTLVSWKFEGLGGWILMAGSVALGVFASVSYDSRVAVFGCLAFFIPGALFITHWQQHHRRILVAVTASTMAALMTLGAVASARVYEHYNGATHPESDVPAFAVDLASWIWTGAVDTDGFTLKARLADADDGVPELLVSPLEGHGPLSVVRVQEGPSAEADVVTYRVTGLRSDTEYSYALRLGDHIDEGRRGTIRTFPEGPASFTLAFASCARTASNGQVYDRIREANPLVYIVPGDIHYENVATADAGRIRSALTRTIQAPAQQALYLSVPIVYAWDDHDFGGDGADSTSGSRATAQEIYREFAPHYDLPGSEGGLGGIYQAFSIGRVRFIVTDTRSDRSPHGITWDPSRTMLGAEQKDWLEQELLSARDSHALVVWVNSIPWIAPAEDDRDDWGGFAHERREISDFIVDNGITNLAMLSGDAHMLAIDDGSNNTFDSSGEGPGFPVFHAAALDRRGKVKGGPYSEGTYPGGGQFGLMTVTDTGGAITVDWSGRNYRGEVLVTYDFELPG